MKKKLVLVLVSVFVVCFCFGLIGCKKNKKTTENNTEQYAIYQTYVANAEDNGITPLSYEEWLKSIKGEKGDKGDTGATGQAGQDGEQGQQGEQGPQGEQGQAGHDGKGIVSIEKTSTVGNVDTYTITFTDNTATTFIITNGVDGQDGEQGLQGEKGDKGEQGQAGEKGDKGDKGETGATGQAGQDGKDGKGIVSIEKISTVGNVDTYTITFTDNTTTTFIIRNGVGGQDGEQGQQGEQGPQGEQGQAGQDGKDGVDGKDGQNGKDGRDGQDGKSAYELYKEKYGYNGTEEEWLQALINGTLVQTQKYTVTFDLNGGNGTIEPQQLSKGDKVQKPSNPTKIGYYFAGWQYNGIEGECWNFIGYSVSEDFTLKAVWIPLSYTLTFDNGAHYTITATKNGEPITSGESVMIEDTITFTVTANDGYHLDGNIIASGTNRVLQNNTLTNVYENITISANATPNTYTINYDANGGEGEMASQTFTYDIEQALSKNTITKENYVFAGWEYNGNVYSDKQVVKNLTTTNNGNITLKAKWKSAEMNLSFNTAGYGFSFNDLTVYYGKTYKNLPTKAGYTIKWYYDSEKQNEVKPTDTVLITKDSTFYCTATIDLEYTLNADNESYAVTGIINTEKTNLEILDTYNGKPVTEIQEILFSFNATITSIEIPNSVTSIGWMAFHGCNKLTSIEIPDSVTSIGNEAFSSCSSLESIVVASGNTKYHSKDNCLIETATNTLILGCKNSIIPNYVTSIGTYAFDKCSSLTSIVLPDSVTSIGDRAFSYCSSLESIVVASGNTKYHSKDNCIIETATNKLILGCKNSIIPDYVTSIGDRAFYGCSSLTSIVLPNSVTSIGAGAFSECYNLTSIVIPKSVTSIGGSAFFYCSRLEKVYYKGTNTEWGNITIDYSNNDLIDATRYYYSETAPTKSGNFWHYVDGVVTEW